MPHGDPPRAQGNSAAGHRRHVQEIKRRADSDNVSDRVPTPHFVEVDLACRYPVHSSFRIGKPQEHPLGSLADQVRQVRLSEQGLNIGPAAIRLLLGHRRDVELGRAQAGTGYDSGDKVDRLGRDCVHGARHRVEPRPRIDQRAKQHVTRDPSGRIDPSVYAHIRRCHCTYRRRCALDNLLVSSLAYGWLHSYWLHGADDVGQHLVVLLGGQVGIRYRRGQAWAGGTRLPGTARESIPPASPNSRRPGGRQWPLEYLSHLNLQ